MEINKILNIYIPKSLFFLYFTLSILLINKKKNQSSKVCICTIGKEENRYIREFVDYYETLGVDKIYLYDNNDEDKENFKVIIQDYIDRGFVKIINFRGIERPHFKAINDCYVNYNKQYNWLMFYDIDEYIHLDNFKNIKDFLNQKKFNKCKKIYLNWVLHTDNDLIYYENISLRKRFPELEKDAIINKNFSQKVKSILRGNISNFLIANTSHTSHIITNSVKACNGYGKEIKLTKDYFMINSDLKHYYIDHYYTKSVEEFVQKVKRGSAGHGKDKEFEFFRIIRYFIINKFKNIKYKYILDNLGINFIINETKNAKNIL